MNPPEVHEFRLRTRFIVAFHHIVQAKIEVERGGGSKNPLNVLPVIRKERNEMLRTH